MSTQFNCQKHFYFNQFNLFSQTVVIQAIQFSISIAFVHIQLNVKTVLFQTIQVSIGTQFEYQNISIPSNSAYHKYAV